MADNEPAWLRDLRNKVRARLRAQQATQAGLAWHLGISEKHMSQLLTGKVTGTPEMLDRLAAAVGLRIAIADGDPAPVLPGRRPRVRRRPREGDPAHAERDRIAAALDGLAARAVPGVERDAWLAAAAVARGTRERTGEKGTQP